MRVELTQRRSQGLRVWGQGRYGLLEHLAECAYHGSHSDAFEAGNFVLHFVLQLIQYAADYPLLRLWTSGRRTRYGGASRATSIGGPRSRWAGSKARGVSGGVGSRQAATTPASEHIAHQQC